MVVKNSNLFLFYFLSFLVFIFNFSRNKVIENTKNKKRNFFFSSLTKERYPRNIYIDSVLKGNNLYKHKKRKKQKTIHISKNDYKPRASLYNGAVLLKIKSYIIGKLYNKKKECFLSGATYTQLRLFDIKKKKWQNKDLFCVPLKRNSLMALDEMKQASLKWNHSNLNIHTNNRKKKSMSNRDEFKNSSALANENVLTNSKNNFNYPDAEHISKNPTPPINYQNEENKRKENNSKSKKKFSEKSLKSMKEKLKIIMTQKWKDASFREKMLKAFRKRDKTHNTKISMALKNKWKYDENYKKKTLEGQRKYILKRKNENADKISEETKRKISKAMKLHWINKNKLKKTQLNYSPTSVFKKRKKYKKVWEDIYSIILNQNTDDLNNYQTFHNLSVNLQAILK